MKVFGLGLRFSVWGLGLVCLGIICPHSQLGPSKDMKSNAKPDTILPPGA